MAILSSDMSGSSERLLEERCSTRSPSPVVADVVDVDVLG
jgi:hypothetical protein